MTSEPREPRTTGRLEGDADSGATSSAGEAAVTAAAVTPEGGAGAPEPAPESDWPDLDQLVQSVKTKREEELTREEERRAAVQKAAQEAQRVWTALNAQHTLETMAAR